MFSSSASRALSHSSLLLGLILLSVPASGQAQETRILGLRAGSSSWCDDSGTLCWDETRNFLNGLRVVAEPKFGTIFDGGDNRVDSRGVANLTITGFEFNLYKAIAALQVAIILPGQVTLDSQSPLRRDERLLNADGKIDVDYGYSVGVTLLDGILSFGIGFLNFDERDIVSPSSSETRNAYRYFNIQAISGARALIKGLKNPN